MIYLYLASLLFGGVMIGTSLLFGGNHSHGGVLHDVGAEGWLRFGGMRFWNFLLLTFGLTGTLFTLDGSLGDGAALAISALVGVVGAFGATTALKRLSSRFVSSEVKQEDFVGATAKALLPMSEQKRGKIRVYLKGQAHDLQAVIEGGDDIQPKDEVVVVGINEDVATVVKVNR